MEGTNTEEEITRMKKMMLFALLIALLALAMFLVGGCGTLKDECPGGCDTCGQDKTDCPNGNCPTCPTTTCPTCPTTTCPTCPTCPVIPPCVCSGGVNDLTLAYDGESGVYITVTGANGQILYPRTQNDRGDALAFVGSGEDYSLGSKIYLKTCKQVYSCVSTHEVCTTLEIDTSCATAITTGTVFTDQAGRTYTVVYGASVDNGSLCEPPASTD